MWNPSEFNQDGEVPKLDPEFAFRSHLQHKSNPIWPPHVMMQRKQQPASMATSSSSGLNFQMEPPSNQGYYSNYRPPLWPKEKKIDESSSCWNGGGAINVDSGNAIFREGPSSSTAFHVDWTGGSSELNPKKVIKENGALDGTFLTLGPPAITSSSTTSKAKQPLAVPASHYRDFSEFDMFPFQGNTGDPFFRPFYSFFPPKGQQIGRLAANSNDRREEMGVGLDLNLKL